MSLPSLKIYAKHVERDILSEEKSSQLLYHNFWVVICNIMLKSSLKKVHDILRTNFKKITFYKFKD